MCVVYSTFIKNTFPIAFVNKNPEGCYQNTWESSRAQNFATGAFVNFASGNHSRDYFKSTDGLTVNAANALLTEQVNAIRSQLENPGLIGGATSSSNFEFSYDSNGRINNARVDKWFDSPYQRGAYTYWRYGEYKVLV